MSDDDLTRLHKRMDQQSDILVEVRDSVLETAAAIQKHQAVCKERMKHIDVEIGALKRTVWGNGREGHDDRIKGLETTVNGVVETVSALQTERKRMGVGTTQISVKAVVAIMAAIGTMLGGLMAYLPKIIQAFGN